MNHFTPPAITVYPDDDAPRYPHPGDDALASPQSRRYIASGADGKRSYSVSNETTRRREVVIHA